jgi:hypothetical protein
MRKGGKERKCVPKLRMAADMHAAFCMMSQRMGVSSCIRKLWLPSRACCPMLTADHQEQVNRCKLAPIMCVCVCVCARARARACSHRSSYHARAHIRNCVAPSLRQTSACTPHEHEARLSTTRTG